MRDEDYCGVYGGGGGVRKYEDARFLLLEIALLACRLALSPISPIFSILVIVKYALTVPFTVPLKVVFTP